MSEWLDPVRAALDESPKTVRFFVRDDDAGWDDDGLARLLNCCAAHEVHIDIAVIPVELDRHLATTLCAHAATGLVHLHQHGFRHVNHESDGRQYEFGPSRNHDQQLADIAEGRQLIDEHLHPYVDPVFTPPWNRCTDETAAALANLGFKVLSRDLSADRFGRDDLAEVPVTVDWFAKHKRVPLTRAQIGQQIADQISVGDAPVGVMLHHAVTNDENLASIDELLALIAGHETAVSTSIYNSSL